MPNDRHASFPIPVPDWIRDYKSEWIKLDVIAGLTAAAVVIPKAMAYATIAGLPVQVGLYTALLPMVIYALLGTSRPLSVSTTTTIAILTAAALGQAAPGEDPASLLTASATLTLLVGAILVLAAFLRLGFVANFISEPVLIGFKAGIGLVIVLDQVPKLLGIHFPKGSFFHNVLAIAQGIPRYLDGDPGRGGRDGGHSGGGRALRSASAGAAHRRGQRDRRHEPVRLAGLRSGNGRPRSDRVAVSHPAGPRADRTALARGLGYRTDELHRNDCGRARIRGERRAYAAGEPGTARDRSRECGRRISGRDAGRRRDLTDCREPPGGGSHTAGGAGRRRGHARDDAGAGSLHRR